MQNKKYGDCNIEQLEKKYNKNKNIYYFFLLFQILLLLLNIAVVHNLTSFAATDSIIYLILGFSITTFVTSILFGFFFYYGVISMFISNDNKIIDLFIYLKKQKNDDVEEKICTLLDAENVIKK